MRPYVLAALAQLALIVSAASPASAQDAADSPIEQAAQQVKVAVTESQSPSPSTPQPAPPMQDTPIEEAQTTDFETLEDVVVETLPSLEELEGRKVKTPAPAATSSSAVEDAHDAHALTKEDLRATIEMFRRLHQKVDDGVAKVTAAVESFADPYGGDVFDLTPYVPGDAWAAVVTDLYNDDCKDALAKMRDLTGAPDDATQPALKYMWARIQMCAGEATEGRKTLTALSQGDGPVAVLAARRLGENVTVKVDDEGEEGMYLSGRIRAAKKTAERDLDAGLEALTTLRGEMKTRLDRFKVDRARAQVLRDAKRYDEASELFLRLYRYSRSWSINGSIEDEIEALERRSGKKILTYGERIDRMRSLVARGRYKEARQVSIANAKIRGVKGNEIRGWTLYREALQAERDKQRTKANEMFAKAEKLIKDPEVRPRLYFGWAQSLRRTDRDSEAIALYERLCSEHPKNLLCGEATYEAGRLLQYQNKHERALAKFDAVIEHHPDDDQVADSLWRKAFSHYLLGDYEAMEAPLKRLQAEFGDEKDASELTLGLKSSYWLAMAALRGGDLALAKSRLQATIDRGALTWYGRLAATRMAQQGWTPHVPMPARKLSADELGDLATLRIPQSARLQVAVELSRLGLWRDALQEARTQTNIHPVPDGAHRLLGATYLANGRPDWAHWVMKSHIAESGPTWSTLRDWGTAFPLDYMELSHAKGIAAGVSPFLVQAIIRQESGFRPAVSSWAGAVGLMQLMPGTAAYTARVFKQERTKFRRADLQNPETNVALGARYIRLHTAHAHDSIPLALAGYNAGPRPLESWVQRYSDRELDAWVESITYREARGYVRKVYTSFITYSALYGGELPELNLEVPSTLPSWGDVPEMTRLEARARISMR